MSRDRPKEYVDVQLYLHHETEMAILVSETDDEDDAVWLPKSQITYEQADPFGSLLDVTIPEWLAMDKDLL